jgi:hypothetical protein
MTETDYPIVVPTGQVSETYRHQPKVVTPGDDFVLASAQLKWYDIYPGAASDAAVGERARSFLRDETVAGRLAFDDDLGFIVLHRCGAAFYFLLVSVWRNDNELWEAVYACDEGGDFAPVEGGHTRATYCVWELGAVCHEQRAWTRYLYSDRGPADRARWLADRLSGEV